MSARERDAPSTFILLSDYERPPLPTNERMRRLVARLLTFVKRRKSKPFIADDRLARSTIETLDTVVAPPACGPLLEEMGATVRDWRAGVEAARCQSRLLLVMPPCDGGHILNVFAEREGLQILAPPERERLVSLAAHELPDLSGEGVLVVPQLERWFLRQRNGLRLVRRLFAAIDTSERPVIVGCNSWAWAYLSRAVEADALLPDPRIFRAFDADRLHLWFSDLARDEATKGVRFRLPETGADVLERDEEGGLASDFLHSLAGKSRGIPWVAWHLWRRSLRSEQEPSLAEETGEAVTGGDRAGEQTLWVAALDEYVLPGVHEQTALLILHALLLHGGLTVHELRLVLPTVGESNIMPVLAASGFVERREGAFHVRPAAYPAVRAGLAEAGYPMDGV